MNKDQVDYLQACLTPIIAIAGIYYAHVQHKLNEQRRHDDLYDRRFEFFKKVTALWMCTSHGDEGQELGVEDVAPFAIEADFLFGSDISTHIMSLEGKRHTGSDFFPNSDFTEPFSKYLKLQINTTIFG